MKETVWSRGDQIDGGPDIFLLAKTGLEFKPTGDIEMKRFHLA